MQCIYCGNEVEYHRQVVELPTHFAVGGLCECCERDRLASLRGQSANRTDDRTACVVCGRTARYALPEHSIFFDETGGVEHRIEGFPIHEGTPKLCDAHLPQTRSTGRVPADGTPEVRHP